MKTMAFLLCATALWADEPKPFVLPSERPKDWRQARAERQTAERFARQIEQQADRDRERLALERIAYALERRP